MKHTLIIFLVVFSISSYSEYSQAGWAADALGLFRRGKSAADEAGEGAAKGAKGAGDEADGAARGKDETPPPVEIGADGATIEGSKPFTLDTIAKEIKPNPGIKGQDFFVRQLADVFRRVKKAAAIIVAPAGTGKSAVAEYLVHLIQTKSSAVRNLWGFKVYNLDVTAITGGTKFSGDLEANFRKFRQFLEKNHDSKIILVVDELEEMLKSENGLKFLTDLKPYFSGEMGVKLMFNITPGPFNDLMKDPQLIRRLFKLIKEVPDDFIVRQIGTYMRESLERKFGIKMTSEQEEMFFRLSKRHPELENPDVLITMMEDAVYKAVSEMESGRSQITQLVSKIEAADGQIQLYQRGIDEGIPKYNGPFYRDEIQRLTEKRDKWQRIVDDYDKAFEETEEMRAQMLELIARRKKLFEKMRANEADDVLGGESIEQLIEPLTAQIDELGAKILGHNERLLGTELQDRHIIEAAAAMLNKSLEHVRQVMNGGLTAEHLTKIISKGVALSRKVMPRIIERIVSRSRVLGNQVKIPTYIIVGDTPSEIEKFVGNFSEAYYGTRPFNMNLAEISTDQNMTDIQGAGRSFVGYGEETPLMEVVRLTAGDMAIFARNLPSTARAMQKFLVKLIREGQFTAKDGSIRNMSRGSIFLPLSGAKGLKKGQIAHLGKLKTELEKQEYLKRVLREQFDANPQAFTESKFIDDELLDEATVIFAQSDSAVEANLKPFYLEKLRSGAIKRILANNTEIGVEFDDAFADRFFDVIKQVGVEKVDDLVIQEIVPVLNRMIEEGVIVNGDNIVLTLDDAGRIVAQAEDWTEPAARQGAIAAVARGFERANGVGATDEIDEAVQDAEDFFGQ